MKVFNLCCSNEHPFEGWFSSGGDYENQQVDGSLRCPVCDTTDIRRLPSAPRLNLSGAKARSPERARNTDSAERQMVAQPTVAQMQALWSKMAEHIRENTEDVGEKFAEEARRIHYDEAPERGIRGVATQKEADELADEGIEVVAFPVPEAPKGPLQ